MKKMNKKTVRGILFTISFIIFVIGTVGQTELYAYIQAVGGLFIAILFFKEFKRHEVLKKAHPRLKGPTPIIPFFLVFMYISVIIFGLFRARLYSNDYSLDETIFLLGIGTAVILTITLVFAFVISAYPIWKRWV